VSAISECIKFLPSLKHLSLFFLSFFKESESKSAGTVERGKVVKKFDLRLTMYVDSFLFELFTVLQ
jgi:hypothetical protein